MHRCPVKEPAGRALLRQMARAGATGGGAAPAPGLSNDELRHMFDNVVRLT